MSLDVHVFLEPHQGRHPAPPGRASTGFPGNQFVNTAEVSNRGFEVKADVTAIARGISASSWGSISAQPRQDRGPRRIRSSPSPGPSDTLRDIPSMVSGPRRVTSATMPPCRRLATNVMCDKRGRRRSALRPRPGGFLGTTHQSSRERHTARSRSAEISPLRAGGISSADTRCRHG